MAKKKSVVYPVLFMLGLTLVLTLALALLNQVTTPTVKFNQDIELKHKILNVFNILPKDTSASNIDKTFKDNVVEEDYKDSKLYILKQNGEEKSYAVPVNGPGLWGSISGYVGITKDMKKIVGIEFIKQEETPGLGGRITEDEYKNQYRGLDISNPVDGKIVINRPANGGNIDAISGATQTSTFVVNMINEDVNEFIKNGGK
ncbi:FMN-binding protein [uncultured Finegoldia sp.]|uniref:FMN-binding protein n=1 Tax=uncultured Finegoldia sp. TaxID=328009 RepID=UPI00261B0867|nr:FMN-binding protein [uncultured Finegoldia sp.]